MLLLLTGCVLGTQSPVEERMACVPGSAQLWRIKGAKAGQYFVSVDTVSERTTFDPTVSLYRIDKWDSNPTAVEIGDFVDGADDSFGCAFPPPIFECPQFTETMSIVNDDLLVIVEVVGECEGADAGYELTVERDDKRARLAFVGSAEISDLDFGPVDDTGVF